MGTEGTKRKEAMGGKCPVMTCVPPLPPSSFLLPFFPPSLPLLPSLPFFPCCFPCLFRFELDLKSLTESEFGVIQQSVKRLPRGLARVWVVARGVGYAQHLIGGVIWKEGPNVKCQVGQKGFHLPVAHLLDPRILGCRHVDDRQKRQERALAALVLKSQ